MGEPAAEENAVEPAAEVAVEEPAAEENAVEPAAEVAVGEPAAEENAVEPAAETTVGEPAAEETVGEPAARMALGEKEPSAKAKKFAAENLALKNAAAKRLAVGNANAAKFAADLKAAQAEGWDRCPVCWAPRGLILAKSPNLNLRVHQLDCLVRGAHKKNTDKTWDFVPTGLTPFLPPQKRKIKYFFLQLRLF